MKLGIGESPSVVELVASKSIVERDGCLFMHILPLLHSIIVPL